MLDANLKQQLQGLLTNLREPIELLSSLDDSAKSAELASLLDEIALLSDKVSVSRTDDDARRPSFLIRRASDPQVAVRFAGIPLGHEFTSLVLALLQVGGHPPKPAPEVLDQVRALDGDSHFEPYFSLSCQKIGRASCRERVCQYV